MRKYLVYIGVAFIMLLFSCSDNQDDALQLVPSEILGKWRLIEQISANCTNPVNNLVETKTCDNQECLQYEFKEDKSVRIIEIENGNRSSSDGKFFVTNSEIVVDIQGRVSRFYYETRPDTLTLSFNSVDPTCSLIGIFEMN